MLTVATGVATGVAAASTTMDIDGFTGAIETFGVVVVGMTDFFTVGFFITLTGADFFATTSVLVKVDAAIGFGGSTGTIGIFVVTDGIFAVTVCGFFIAAVTGVFVAAGGLTGVEVADLIVVVVVVVGTTDFVAVTDFLASVSPTTAVATGFVITPTTFGVVAIGTDFFATTLEAMDDAVIGFGESDRTIGVFVGTDGIFATAVRAVAGAVGGFAAANGSTGVEVAVLIVVASWIFAGIFAIGGVGGPVDAPIDFAAAGRISFAAGIFVNVVAATIVGTVATTAGATEVVCFVEVFDVLTGAVTFGVADTAVVFGVACILTTAGATVFFAGIADEVAGICSTRSDFSFAFFATDTSDVSALRFPVCGFTVTDDGPLVSIGALILSCFFERCICECVGLFGLAVDVMDLVINKCDDRSNDFFFSS